MNQNLSNPRGEPYRERAILFPVASGRGGLFVSHIILLFGRLTGVVPLKSNIKKFNKCNI